MTRFQDLVATLLSNFFLKKYVFLHHLLIQTKLLFMFQRKQLADWISAPDIIFVNKIKEITSGWVASRFMGCDLTTKCSEQPSWFSLVICLSQDEFTDCALSHWLISYNYTLIILSSLCYPMKLIWETY